MKKSLMSILVCPVCKGELMLHSDAQTETDTIHGSLTCILCKAVYPIKDSIPNLLPHQLHS